MNVHDKIDALDPNTARLFDALIDLLLGEKASFFRHVLEAEDPNDYPTGPETAEAMVKLIDFLGERRAGLEIRKAEEGSWLAVRVWRGEWYRDQASNSLGVALGLMALHVAAEDEIKLGAVMEDQQRYTVEEAIDLGLQLEAERLAETYADDPEEPGRLHTFQVGADTLEMRQTEELLICYSINGREQLRVDMEGVVWQIVNGEKVKLGKVEVPERERGE